MSDKNRNMNDINDQKTAEQQAFSEEIRRRLAEPGSGKPTLDEFKVMVYKDREKRRKKRNALIACIVAAFIVGYLTYDDLVPEVGADKNPKETIQTEDGVIIEDGGWGSSTEEKTLIIESRKDIDIIKSAFPNLPDLEYIPEGYKFEELAIESLNTGIITYEYFFKNGDSRLEIEVNQSNGTMDTIDISNISEKRMCKRGQVFFQNEGIKKATIQLDDGTVISIWSDLPQEEILKIIENVS